MLPPYIPTQRQRPVVVVVILAPVHLILPSHRPKHLIYHHQMVMVPLVNKEATNSTILGWSHIQVGTTRVLTAFSLVISDLLLFYTLAFSLPLPRWLIKAQPRLGERQVLAALIFPSDAIHTQLSRNTSLTPNLCHCILGFLSVFFVERFSFLCHTSIV